MSLIPSAANVIVGILGAVTATEPVGGAKSAISGAAALSDLYKRLTAKTPALGPRIAADLTAAMENQHLTEPQRRLIPQMIAAAPLTPAEVMACARNPARICDTMLAKLKDPAHHPLITQDAFRRVVDPILTNLLADTAVSDALRPAFETAAAESLAFIAEQVEALTAQVKDAFERAAIAEFVVKELARRYVPGSDGDFEQARLGLENALQAYQNMRAQNALPHNAADQVDAVLAEVQKLNDAARLDQAGDALARALAAQRERVAEETSGLMRLLDSAVAQATLQNRPDQAAEALVERLMLDAPEDRFSALRALQDVWYVRGRDSDLAFDLEVSIALARHTQSLAIGPDQRGAVQFDLGTALATLGEREAGKERLEAAVQALRAAQDEWTRDRAPHYWAAAQMNLGNALRALGERETGTDRLDEAVNAYREVLKEWTRDHVPLDWARAQMNLGATLQTMGERGAGKHRLEAAIQAYGAALEEWTRNRLPLEWAKTQMNLGTALQTLGAQDPGTERLQAAVWAFRAALEVLSRAGEPLTWARAHVNHGNALTSLGVRENSKERLEAAVQAHRAALGVLSRDRVPLDWAMTQMNLGNALRTLGEREAGTARLEEAMAAYRTALEENTRDRVPLQWAMTQANLAFVEAAFFDRTHDPARLVAAREHALAAREVFVAAGAEHYIAVTDALMAQIDAA